MEAVLRKYTEIIYKLPCYKCLILISFCFLTLFEGSPELKIRALPVSGASVVVSGTSTGAVTELDGEFRLEVPAGSRTLDITYVGMKKQTVQITSAPVSVVLEMVNGECQRPDPRNFVA